MPPKRCPYFDCQQEFSGRLSRYVHLCPACRRLSIECEQSGCEFLNRPFTLFCRNCRDDMLDNCRLGTSEEMWQDASRAPLECQYASDGSSVAGGPSAPRIRGVLSPGPVETLTILSELRSYDRRPSLLTMEFIEGLLAIHQMGGFLAVFHPFRDRGNRSGPEGAGYPWLFEVKDASRYARRCRPFSPLKMSDHRHIIFSTPYSVYAVNVWSLPDWAYRRERPRHYQVVDCITPTSPELTTAPLPLGGSRLGLISKDPDGRYLWATLDLKQVAAGSPIRDLASISREMPIVGEYCQAEVVGKSFLAIFTSKGHWVWRVEDASSSDFSAMARTLDAGEDRLVTHQHTEKANEFRSLRHFRFFPGTLNHPVNSFTWYYKYKHPENPIAPLRCYKVDLNTLQRDNPTLLDDSSGTIPLGVHQDAGGLRRVLFCRGRKLCVDEGLRLQEIPEQGQIEDVELASGFLFTDPLLGVIESQSAPHVDSSWQLTVRSINHPNWHLDVNLHQLRSDPLIWSRWLFTVESGDQGRSWRLNRRNLFSSLEDETRD
jgi:hypothetical protein